MKKNKKNKYIMFLAVFILMAVFFIFSHTRDKDSHLELILEEIFIGNELKVYQDNSINNENLQLLVNYNNDQLILGTFDIEGGQKETYVNDIFIYNDKYLVIIIAEDISRPFIELNGISYEVYFYDKNFVENNDLLDYFNDGNGFDGIAEGEEIIFKYKTKESIIKRLQELELEAKI